MCVRIMSSVLRPLRQHTCGRCGGTRCVGTLVLGIVAAVGSVGRHCWLAARLCEVFGSQWLGW